jgi:hypothetical protein
VQHALSRRVARDDLLAVAPDVSKGVAERDHGQRRAAERGHASTAVDLARAVDGVDPHRKRAGEALSHHDLDQSLRARSAPW